MASAGGSFKKGGGIKVSGSKTVGSEQKPTDEAVGTGMITGPEMAAAPSELLAATASYQDKLAADERTLAGVLKQAKAAAAVAWERDPSLLSDPPSYQFGSYHYPFYDSIEEERYQRAYTEHYKYLLAERDEDDDREFVRTMFADRSSVGVSVDESARNLEHDLFGRHLDPSEYADLVGAPADSRVWVRESGDYEGTIHIRTDHAFYGGQDRYVYQHEGETYLYNAYFRLVDDAPKGMGSRIFAREVETATALGLTAITVNAAGSRNQPDWQGYTAWANLGYDADLPSSHRNLLQQHADAGLVPEAWAEARTMNQLIMAGGQEWWKHYGSGWDGVFTLSKDSSSQYILQRQLARRQVAGAGLVPENPPPAPHYAPSFVDIRDATGPSRYERERDEDYDTQSRIVRYAPNDAISDAEEDDPNFDDGSERAERRFDREYVEEFLTDEGIEDARKEYSRDYAVAYENRREELEQSAVERWSG